MKKNKEMMFAGIVFLSILLVTTFIYIGFDNVSNQDNLAAVKKREINPCDFYHNNKKCVLYIHGSNADPNAPFGTCWSGMGTHSSCYSRIFTFDWSNTNFWADPYDIADGINNTIDDMVNAGCKDIVVNAHSGGGFYASIALRERYIPRICNNRCAYTISFNTIASPLLGMGALKPPYCYLGQGQDTIPCGLSQIAESNQCMTVTNYVTTGHDGTIPDVSQPAGTNIPGDHCSAVTSALITIGNSRNCRAYR